MSKEDQRYEAWLRHQKRYEKEKEEQRVLENLNIISGSTPEQRKEIYKKMLKDEAVRCK